MNNIKHFFKIYFGVSFFWHIAFTITGWRIGLFLFNVKFLTATAAAVATATMQSLSEPRTPAPVVDVRDVGELMRAMTATFEMFSLVLGMLGLRLCLDRG